MVVRNIAHFGVRRTVNNYYSMPARGGTNQCCKSSGGLGWGWFAGMAALGLANTIVGGIGEIRESRRAAKAETPDKTEGNAQQDKNIKKLAKEAGFEVLIEDGQYTVLNKDKFYEGTYEVVRQALLDEISGKAKAKPETEEPKTEEPKTEEPKTEKPATVETPTEEEDPTNEYGIERKDQYESYTIAKGNTWASIAAAKYDIPAGVTLKDVYRALAKANYEGDDFDAAMKQGIIFHPGDKIKLPKELEINGQKVKLQSNHNDRKADDSNTDFTSKSSYKIAKSVQIGSQWFVTVNGKVDTTLGAFDSEAAAKAKIEELKAE